MTVLGDRDKTIRGCWPSPHTRFLSQRKKTKTDKTEDPMFSVISECMRMVYTSLNTGTCVPQISTYHTARIHTMHACTYTLHTHRLWSGWRNGLSEKESVVFMEKTVVQLAASTLCGSHTSVSPTPGRSKPLIFQGTRI